MKHIETIDFRNKLQKVNDVNHFAINYAIKRSLDGLKTAIAPLSTQENEINAIAADYEKERVALCELMATKDGLVLRNEDFSFAILPENKTEFDKKLTELQVKHKEQLDIQSKKAQEFKAFLDSEESSFVPYTIALSKIPADLSISKESMDAIYPLLDETK